MGKDIKELAARPEAKQYWEGLKKEYAAENKINNERRLFIKKAVEILGGEKVMSAFSKRKKAEKVIKGECGYNSIERNEIEYLIQKKNDNKMTTAQEIEYLIQKEREELTKITDDFGDTVYGKESWGEEYAITELDDGTTFQTTYGTEHMHDHEYIEAAVEEIENHIEGMKEYMEDNQ